MIGKRIAILGLGRSGLAVGKAALALGAVPKVFDEKPADALTKGELIQEAAAIGLEVETGYRPHQGWFAEFGPDFIVTNPAVPKTHRALHSGFEVLSEVEFAYRISKAPIVAITGTNGKSTTTVMTYLCLRACGVDAVLCGNIFGSGFPETTLTEAALSSKPEQVLVAEISSFQLEWVSTFHPLAAAITNISPDHLDRYASFADYAATKMRIFDQLGHGDTAVVGPELSLSGFSSRNFVVGRDAMASGDSIQVFGKNLPKSELYISEPHNYTNACFAALLGLGVLGEQALPCVFEGLRSFKGLAHRMERLGSKDGVAVINNSMCTNPAAVVSSSQGLLPVVHLLIGGVNKELDFAPLSDYLRATANRAYIFGTDAENINKMLDRQGRTYRTMEEAFKAATDEAKPGDTIMLAPGCASTDQFRDFRHRGDVFKAIAMEWLNS